MWSPESTASYPVWLFWASMGEVSPLFLLRWVNIDHDDGEELADLALLQVMSATGVCVSVFINKELLPSSTGVTEASNSSSRR